MCKVPNTRPELPSFVPQMYPIQSGVSWPAERLAMPSLIHLLPGLSSPDSPNISGPLGSKGSLSPASPLSSPSCCWGCLEFPPSSLSPPKDSCRAASAGTPSWPLAGRTAPSALATPCRVLGFAWPWVPPPVARLARVHSRFPADARSQSGRRGWLWGAGSVDPVSITCFPTFLSGHG